MWSDIQSTGHQRRCLAYLHFRKVGAMSTLACIAVILSCFVILGCFPFRSKELCLFNSTLYVNGISYIRRLGRLLQPEPLEQMVSKNKRSAKKNTRNENKIKCARDNDTQQQRNPNMICALRTMHTHICNAMHRSELIPTHIFHWRLL